jgi:hypothetical protein
MTPKELTALIGKSIFRKQRVGFSKGTGRNRFTGKGALFPEELEACFAFSWGLILKLKGVFTGIEPETFGLGGAQGAGFGEHLLAVEGQLNGALSLEGKIETLAFFEEESSGVGDRKGSSVQERSGRLVLFDKKSGQPNEVTIAGFSLLVVCQ